jgi:hypothetical protein
MAGTGGKFLLREGERERKREPVVKFNWNSHFYVVLRRVTSRLAGDFVVDEKQRVESLSTSSRYIDSGLRSIRGS